MEESARLWRPELQAGAFYVAGKAVRPKDSQPYDPEAGRRLIELSAQLTGVTAEEALQLAGVRQIVIESIGDSQLS